MSTQVTCENGHYIAMYTGESAPGACVVAEHFTDYTEGVGPWEPLDEIKPRCCPKCSGAVFDMTLTGGVLIHTTEGWLP